MRTLQLWLSSAVGTIAIHMPRMVSIDALIARLVSDAPSPITSIGLRPNWLGLGLGLGSGLGPGLGPGLGLGLGLGVGHAAHRASLRLAHHSLAPLELRSRRLQRVRRQADGARLVRVRVSVRARESWWRGRWWWWARCQVRGKAAHLCCQ